MRRSIRCILAVGCGNRFFYSLVLIGVVFGFYSNPAVATTMRAYTSEDLVATSDLVVIGSASEIKAQRDERGKVVRVVTFIVDEYVVGQGGGTLPVRLLGGTLKNIASKVSGAVDLKIGEPTLLFLRKQPVENSDFFLVVGMSQGQFTIKEEKETKQHFITKCADQSVLLTDEVANDSLSLGRNNTSIYISIERFVEQIRRISQTLGGKKK